MPKILIIDDNEMIRKQLVEVFSYEGYEVEEAIDGVQGIAKIKTQNFNLVLSDVSMPKKSGIEVLEAASKIKPDLPFIIITGVGSIEQAVEAVKKGAFDFIEKPLDLHRLLISTRNALEKTKLIEETKDLRQKVTKVRPIIGESPLIEKIRLTIEKVAPTDARILITGENGTGKELVARWIHEKSHRSSGPFVEVNCAAIPSELIESELFGHEKGAFTSADRQRIGKFEQANGGTLFLDEIGDMSLSAQAKVLRVLQENTITRVGGDKNIAVSVRVISATNKELVKEVNDSKFRLDLFHRINVIPIEVPKLDDRKSDIPILSKHFLNEISSEYSAPPKQITEEALEVLKNYSWKGNIRELRNVMERLYILCDNEITGNDVVKFVSYGKSTQSNQINENLFERFNSLQDFKDYVEQLFIEYKLMDLDWNITKTADILGIQRSHLYNKIEKYGLKKEA